MFKTDIFAQSKNTLIRVTNDRTNEFRTIDTTTNIGQRKKYGAVGPGPELDFTMRAPRGLRNAFTECQILDGRRYAVASRPSYRYDKSARCSSIGSSDHKLFYHSNILIQFCYSNLRYHEEKAESKPSCRQ
jgi:hypothetical protein